MNIMFIFDRYRRSSAAVIPVKYECDSQDLRVIVAKSKILLTEKWTNGALVTPPLKRAKDLAMPSQVHV